jgi:hypothetical protein
MSIDFIFPIIFMQVMLFSLVSNEYSAWCWSARIAIYQSFTKDTVKNRDVPS